MAMDYMNSGGQEKAIISANTIKGGGDFFLADSRSHHFPEDYPDEYVNLSIKHSVKIACLSQEKCLEYKKLIQQKF